MHVLNSGPRLRIYTFDGDQVIRLRPGESAEVEGAKHVDVRDVETEDRDSYAAPFGKVLDAYSRTELRRRIVLDDDDTGDAR